VERGAFFFGCGVYCDGVAAVPLQRVQNNTTSTTSKQTTISTNITKKPASQKKKEAEEDTRAWTNHSRREKSDAHTQRLDSEIR
jgi:hypothetical protein